MPQLKDHLLSRLLDLPYDGEEHTFSDAESNTVTIIGGKIYKHKNFRINYTTYDLRRSQDCVNPRSEAPDIMVLAHEDSDHPYWYARVLGVFHANICHSGLRSRDPSPQHIEFLFIRWFGRDLTTRTGWNAHRLPRIGFIDADEPGAFAFLDPRHVVRAIHTIPAFAHGRTDEYLRPSIARHPRECDEDWVYYYVNM